ncbi:MAG: 5-dehydro-4-deoxyglucarate dehydratase [Trueperaceae bacterium]|nr:5-dehydro-4-deoxyglucarate dehydratase [Trueperaceae bacterium]
MRGDELFAGGPLAFPITPFTLDGAVDLPEFKRHVGRLQAFGPPAMFVACGTGELSSLEESEVAELVAAAVEVVGSGTPVIAGVGHGLKVAENMIRAADAAGATGFLVLPPYLISGEQEGMYQYYRALAAASDKPMILYQRDTARLVPSTVVRLAELPNIVGFKDGLGDVELFQRIVTTVGSRLAYFNGMPTAETFQLAYAGMNAPHYSSAVFNFVPELAWAFYRALNGGDPAVVDRLLRDFFMPFAELRGKVKGYAVALIKAGVELRWGTERSVRPPLVMARAEHVAELAGIVERVRDVVGEGWGARI